METADVKKKKFYKRWWFWLVMVVVLFILIGSSGKSSKQSVPANPDNSQSSSSAPAQTVTMPQTLLKLSGSGTKTTQSFTAAKNWDLNWSYDCSNFGNQGNFVVTTYNDSGSPSFSNAPVNQLGSSDSGVEHYHNGGTFYLEVNSECKWNIEVKG